jgi:hypothetical protein
MAITAGKVIVNDKALDKKTLMENRNISLVEKISRENATPIKSKSAKITVIENGVEKVVYKSSKYLEDLTKKGE